MPRECFTCSMRQNFVDWSFSIRTWILSLSSSADDRDSHRRLRETVVFGENIQLHSKKVGYVQEAPCAEKRSNAAFTK